MRPLWRERSQQALHQKSFPHWNLLKSKPMWICIDLGKEAVSYRERERSQQDLHQISSLQWNLLTQWGKVSRPMWICIHLGNGSAENRERERSQQDLRKKKISSFKSFNTVGKSQNQCIAMWRERSQQALHQISLQWNLNKIRLRKNISFVLDEEIHPFVWDDLHALPSVIHRAPYIISRLCYWPLNQLFIPTNQRGRRERGGLILKQSLWWWMCISSGTQAGRCVLTGNCLHTQMEHIFGIGGGYI